ncbi:helix-turn-helix transcriptional regulator [Streptosporangium sp. NPDC051023]|uniref:helix-turn-helix domain-containing protein n=1 Tax=Streptosporangium sp. NPDC051023 TaxID=3155410 RepID=UPI00344D7E3F
MSGMSFGAELRRWRLLRGMAQLELAYRAGTGQRHLSFLERGLTQPGRALVLRLAEQLELAPSERDALLLAAGLAPEPEPEPEGLTAGQREMLENVLRSYLPHPAVIFGPYGGVAVANEAVALFTEGAPPEQLSEPASLCRLLANRVADLPAWASHVLEGLREVARRNPDVRLQQAITELSTYVPESRPGNQGFVAPLRLRDSNGEQWLISVITSLSPAADPALKGYRLATFLPAGGEVPVSS